MNKAMIIGNLGADPEVRHTTSGKTVANFNVATTEKFTDGEGVKQERTEWHRCVAWTKTAEIVGAYLQKGSKIYAEGRIQTREWEKDGEKKYTTEIVVNRIEMLGRTKDQQREDTPPSDGGTNAGEGAPGQSDIDDDLPF